MIFSKVVLNFDFTYLVLITLAAVMGHMWPIYYKFKGGRGLATTMGALIVWDFYLALFILIIACLIAYWSRYYSELKPRISLVLLPLFSLTAYYIRFDKNLVLIGIFLAIIVYMKAIQYRYISD
jgi:glycerol-3-phosphate acyltransferase PlsY